MSNVELIRAFSSYYNTIMFIHAIEEHNFLILTTCSKTEIAQIIEKYQPLLHCTESLKHHNIKTFCLYMADEHNC